MTDRNNTPGVAPSPPVISLASAVAAGAALRQVGGGVLASGTSPWAANDLLAFPFTLASPTTFYKAFWLNGSAPGGNYSVGIYDADFRLLVQTASTLGSGASVPQSVALAATTKVPVGLYYCAIAHDDATLNRIFRWSLATLGTSSWKAFGCWRQASVTLATLPNPATPVACNNVGFPMSGLITRSVFDV